MQKRSARLALVALLVAVGGAAAALSWDIDRKIRALDGVQRGLTQRMDSMAAALVDIGLAQHGYVALGGTGAPPDTIVASLIQRFETDADALRVQARSPDAPAALHAIAESMAEVIAADARAQDYVRTGQTFLASDLLFGSVREHLAAAGAHVRELRASEAAAIDVERAALRREGWTAIAAAAAIWAAGLVVLASAGGRSRRPQAPDSREATTSAGGSMAVDAAYDALAPQTPAGRTVDLAAAATLCTDLSRITTTAVLPDLLARAAAIIDARGLIVWMGAGDQLFAAAAHGYDLRIVSRLAPINRTAMNATATAWRTGRLSTVTGEMPSHGAIVAPMFNPTHCIGVLAAEVRPGRENDSGVRAVTAMIAAQFATVVAAWPAASTSGSEGSPARGRAAG